MKNLIITFVLLFGQFAVFAQMGGGTGDVFSRSGSITPVFIPTQIPPAAPAPPDGDGEGGEITMDRQVAWLHGHGGGLGSWDRVANATMAAQVPLVPGYPPRKITSHKVTNDGSENSISYAGTTMMSVLNATFPSNQPPADKERNAIICHSLGGLVAQYTDYLYDNGHEDKRKFYGMATFGTPNQGALLAKNSYPYDINCPTGRFAWKTCQALTKGPVKEEVETNFFLDLFTNNQQVQHLVNGFCEKVSGGLVETVLKKFNTPIAADLIPESQVINLLNSYTPEETFRVAFYGVKDNEDMIWRTMHFMQNSPNASPCFEANDESETLNRMNKNKQQYINKHTEWSDAAEQALDKIDHCWLPGCGIYWANKYKEAVNIRDAYKEGVGWWNSCNDEFRRLVGDLALVPTGTVHCECSDYSQETNTWGPWYPTDDGMNCTNNFPIQWCKLVEDVVEQDVESDGIVTAASAIDLPGAFKAVQLFDTSHFQMPNAGSLKNAFNGLWDGSFGFFFKTDKR